MNNCSSFVIKVFEKKITFFTNQSKLLRQSKNISEKKAFTLMSSRTLLWYDKVKTGIAVSLNKL
jgi:hypothetical protein